MKYTVSTKGIEEVGKMLRDLGAEASFVASKGLYKGAGVMADEVTREAGTIQTEEFHYAVFLQRAPSPEEKAVLTDGKTVGIAKFRKGDGDVNTSVGYGNAGYAEVNGKRKPIPLIANAINSGTSFMKKQPFFRRAVNKGKPKAVTAIKETIEKEIDKKTGGNKA